MVQSAWRGSLQERGVPKEVVKPKKWTKPEIRRIGQIKDVAGPGPIGPQGASSKS